MNATVGFVIGMAGWIYILYEVFAGEAAQASASSNSEGMKSAFNALKMDCFNWMVDLPNWLLLRLPIWRRSGCCYS